MTFYWKFGSMNSRHNCKYFRLEIVMNDKILKIHTEEIQRDGKDSYHFHRYEPTPYEVMDALFNVFTPEKEDVLVDYGCGLGRLNFYLENRFGIRSVGVELVESYFLRALENKEHYKGKRENITFFHAAAQDYEISPSDTIFYFFNPFSIEIFRRVINRILDSWQAYPRKITLILYYPEDDTIFYLEHHTNFRLTDEIAASDAVIKDRRERFCLYTLPDVTH